MKSTCARIAATQASTSSGIDFAANAQAAADVGLVDVAVIALRRQTDYQFSPNWLSGAEDELSQPRFR
jgi:hypothetical protein